MLSQLSPPILLWQVATILLCLAFGYDIFWVFLSPYIMGKSVMVEVRAAGEWAQFRRAGEKCDGGGEGSRGWGAQGTSGHLVNEWLCFTGMGPQLQGVSGTSAGSRMRLLEVLLHFPFTFFLHTALFCTRKPTPWRSAVTLSSHSLLL